MKRFLPASACLLLILSTSLAARRASEQELDGRMHHFGNDATPEWSEAPSEPEGAGLDFEFESTANRGEWTLVFYQRDISNHWQVKINGQLIATCRVLEPLTEFHFAVPAGTLIEGTNRFELTTDTPTDDITFGRIRLIHSSFREALNLVSVSLGVRESSTLNPIPARLTITDAEGAPVKLYYADTLHQAVREGVLYTDSGNAHFEVPAGDYQVVASRGSEWSIDSAALSLSAPLDRPFGGLTAPDALLHLTREVDTTGYVACDTHIHTLTFSGHGDSSVEERMVTLAGEGVELAISTDHNHNTDYAPYQQRMGLAEFFTTVVGNEVTTPIGHFNAFPLDPAGEIPPHRLENVVQLVDGMRERGALAVILNHPRWPSHEDSPFGDMELDHFTGQGNGSHFATYPFDAMELINSCTHEPKPELLFEDWFALLNRGEKVYAVGSSDSHTVGRPVGGGRTYVPSASDDPSAIDADASARAIAAGRTSISMGIYVETDVVHGADATRVGMGELALITGKTCQANLRVQAPSWIRPREAKLYANGTVIETLTLETVAGEATDLRFNLTIEDQHGAQDAWLVWIVTGDAVEGTHWTMLNDYTLGATNPIYLDWSRDGVYQSPLATAQRIREVQGPADLVHPYSWDAVNYHALEISREQLLDEVRGLLEQLGRNARMDPAKLAEYLDGTRVR